MAKLHFRYGTMGSSKSAQLLMTRFNYVEKGRTVWLIKPSVDTRDGKTTIKSRIGLESEADVINWNDNIHMMFFTMMASGKKPDVIIADESQFFTREQIYQLRCIVSEFDVPVLCYGLRTDFQCNLFPGSGALLALADEIEEIKSICSCGNKSIVNARIDENGRVVTDGEQIELGGNDKYTAMCWTCYAKAIENEMPF